MDNRVSISDALLAGTADKITVCGIIEDVSTTHEDTITLLVNDGSTISPIRAMLREAQVKDASVLSRGCTVQLHGTLQPPKQSTLCQGKSRVLVVNDYAILGPADSATFPLAQHGASTEFLDRNPHLRIRTPRYALLARFRSAALSALSTFFDSHPDGPFYQVQLPMLTWTDCEGGAEVFAAPTQCSKREGMEMEDAYFGSRRYLNVSAVFHAEAFVQGLDRVWTLAPCWRAERTDGSRHLAEFWMLEVAMNYITTLEPLYGLMEETIHGIVTRLENSPSGQEMLSQSGSDELRHRWNKLLTSRWPRITFAEATKLLEPIRAANGTTSTPQSTAPRDISGEEEKYLCAHFDSPIFLTHFPSRIRLFQAAQSVGHIGDIPPSTEIDPEQTTEAFDLLLPGIGEICSGGLREHRLDVLIDTMRKKYFLRGQSKGHVEDQNGPADAEPYPYLHPGEEIGSLKWFTDLRRWGTSPHGGFGIGFERLLQYLTGADTVKEVVSFPRYWGVCGC
ncbi:class II aaRS and biotin synthetase [Aspergillus candidus]|uniref:Class II aaRS and biotin synthetase n=1 Tax=Aspergillus candidus TaxID=41067 RepID=A0A2I2FAB9_ASPCN|nr:class II aaRS and biotin synthetase [Aspergillus candidus]PLB37560.1 class II aaRS and biotin synthetase [Aspergillus candidus]